MPIENRFPHPRQALTQKKTEVAEKQPAQKIQKFDYQLRPAHSKKPSNEVLKQVSPNISGCLNDAIGDEVSEPDSSLSSDGTVKLEDLQDAEHDQYKQEGVSVAVKEKMDVYNGRPGQPDLLSTLGGASQDMFDRLEKRIEKDNNLRLASEPSDAINMALNAKTL